MTKKKLKEQIEFLEKELIKLELENKELKEKLEYYKLLYNYKGSLLDKSRSKYNKLLSNLIFEKIIHNENATIVWFPGNIKVVVKKAKDDNDSIYTAVAYAIVKNLFGSNNAFKKLVDRRLKK